MKPLLSLALIIALAGCSKPQAPKREMVDRTGIMTLSSTQSLNYGASSEQTFQTLSMSVGPNNGRFLQSVIPPVATSPNEVIIVMSPLYNQLTTEDQEFLTDALTRQWTTLTKQRRANTEVASVTFRISS